MHGCCVRVRVVRLTRDFDASAPEEAPLNPSPAEIPIDSLTEQPSRARPRRHLSPWASRAPSRSVDAAGPAYKVTNSTLLTAAVGDMGIAYTDAAGRVNPDFVNLGAGKIGGRTLVPGLYKWGTDVSISNDVKLSGGPNDVFIFQVAGNIDHAAAKNVTLIGGVQAKNVFWQTAGAVILGATAHFEGTILSKTLIAMNTGSSINGRLLAQTAVTLQSSTVTQPAK